MTLCKILLEHTNYRKIHFGMHMFCFQKMLKVRLQTRTNEIDYKNFKVIIPVQILLAISKPKSYHTCNCIGQIISF